MAVIIMKSFCCINRSGFESSSVIFCKFDNTFWSILMSDYGSVPLLFSNASKRRLRNVMHSSSYIFIDRLFGMHEAMSPVFQAVLIP